MNSQQRLVGIAGGTCSGKGYLALSLQDTLGPNRCTVLSLDSYYRDLSYLDPSEADQVNFDHPSALDFALFHTHLDTLLNSKAVHIPVYDKGTHHRSKESELVSPTEIIIVEGIFALWNPDLRHRLTLKIFLDVDADIRLARRILRDVIEYGIDVRVVCSRYFEVTRPMHKQFVEPTKNYANLILQGSMSIHEQVSAVLKALNYIL